MEMVPDSPMHAKRIANLTLKDPVISHVLRRVLHEWLTDMPDSTHLGKSATLGVDNKKMVPAAY